jgi:two-component system, NarL family, response regulator DesR
MLQADLQDAAPGDFGDRSMGVIRTLLVDDSRTFLAAATKFLAAFLDIRIVGQALSGAEALELIGRARPDLVLTDLAMPHMTGLELTALIKALDNPPKVIVLTFLAGPRSRDQACAAGADGFIIKARIAQDLVPQIEALFACANVNGETI